jgi:hypothetical protein
MAQPAGKKRRTIEPARVETLDDWIKYHEQDYTNLILDAGGHFSVYDTADSKKLVKRILPKKGIDAIQLLGSSASSELRANAVTKYDELLREKERSVHTISAEYVAKEAELLQQTTLWNQSQDIAQRATLARQIGTLSQELAELDTKRQNAIYANRYKLTCPATYEMLDYTTRNPTDIGFYLAYMRSEYIDKSDRIIAVPGV